MKIDRFEHPMTRREAVRTLGYMGALGDFGMLGQQGPGPFAIPRRRVATAFALIGDRYHNSDHYRTALGRTLVQGAGLTIDFSDEVKLLTPEHLAQYRLLIVLRDGMIWPNGHTGPQSNAGWWSQGQHEIVSDPPLAPTEGQSVNWMTAEQGRAVREFVTNGGSALLYHNVTHVALTNDDFRRVLGGVYQGHPPIRPFRVRILNRDHPITRGVNDFTVTDEQHYMEYQLDRRYLLMESVNEDGLAYRDLGTTAAAGWAYEHGAGRVCYLSPGHLITAMWNPEYEKIQRNAARWLLRES
jgi:type 1 glutamine amidotransferase